VEERGSMRVLAAFFQGQQPPGYVLMIGGLRGEHEMRRGRRKRNKDRRDGGADDGVAEDQG
jgi:hypothetical protein